MKKFLLFSLLSLGVLQTYLALEMLPEFQIPDQFNTRNKSEADLNSSSVRNSEYKGYWNAINGRALATDILVIDAIGGCIVTILIIKEYRNAK